MTTDNCIVTVPCPECEYEISLDFAPQKGEKVTCPNCWAYLEVINVDPLELQWDTAVDDVE